MLVQVRHVTRYRYDQPIDHVLQRLRLIPASSPAQEVLQWSLTAPDIETAAQYVDAFGNLTRLVVHAQPVEEVEIVAEGTVETRETHGVVGFDASTTPPWVFLRETPATAPDRALQRFAAGLAEDAPLTRLHALMAALHERIAFDTDATHSGTSAQEAFAAKRGVCQDHTHVFICVARLLGMPARYVTGYMHQPEEVMALAHHAWAEVFLPDLGWVGFDAANGVSPTDAYVRLACGFDAPATAPVVGARRGGGVEALDVEVRVQQAEQSSQ
jgi:transglutaminase-like putative cysteine protease